MDQFPVMGNSGVGCAAGKADFKRLNADWFLPLDGANYKIAAWRRVDDENRPRCTLQWVTPAEFARQAMQNARKKYSLRREFPLMAGTNSGVRSSGHDSDLTGSTRAQR